MWSHRSLFLISSLHSGGEILPAGSDISLSRQLMLEVDRRCPTECQKTFQDISALSRL